MVELGQPKFSNQYLVKSVEDEAANEKHISSNHPEKLNWWD
jgi:hypothetical protein